MSLQGRTESQIVVDQCHDIIQNLASSAVGVSTVAEAVAKSYTDLPTSEEAIGIKQSKDLVAVREKMTMNLVLFKNLHLPLGDAVVNDLVETLDYFAVDNFDEFKTLIPVVLDQVQAAEERARFVRDLYCQLTTDLEKLGEDAKKVLKAAELEAKAKLDTAVTKGRAAKIIAGVAGATVSAGIGGEHIRPADYV